MMESNPKQRAMTYHAIRRLKYVCVSFRHLYTVTNDDKYQKRYEEMYEILLRCLHDFCDDVEDLGDCECLCEAGHDDLYMYLVDEALSLRQFQAAEEARRNKSP